MKDQITLEELAPYLPYNLPMYRLNRLAEWKAIHLGLGNIGDVIESLERYQLIVRPMSDIHTVQWREIASENARSNNDDYLIQREFNTKSCLSYDFKMWLIKNHFDVFGWIERGLAIDINTINV